VEGKPHCAKMFTEPSLPYLNESYLYVMRVILLLALLFSLSVSYSQNGSYDEIIKLIDQYSYEEEIKARQAHGSYPVVARLTEMVSNDSVYTNFTQPQIREFSHYFLKKRVLSMADFKVKVIYISNMRYWPGEFVAFCINSVLNLNPNQTIRYKEFILISSDFECVKLLAQYNNADQELNKKFNSLTRKYECKEHSFEKE